MRLGQPTTLSVPQQHHALTRAVTHSLLTMSTHLGHTLAVLMFLCNVSGGLLITPVPL